MSDPTTPLFHDCLGHVIQVGDVLACGQRQQGTHGGIRLGIVTGFTEHSILADMLYGYHAGNIWEHTLPNTTWRLKKGHFSAPYNCVITGYTREQLLARVPLTPSAIPPLKGKEIVPHEP